MATLIFADHDNKTLDESVAKVVSAAKALGGSVHILVAGADCAGVAAEAAKLEGVEKVLHADSSDLANRLAEPSAALLLSLKDSYDAFISAATTTGKNVLPRLAALLDVMQVSDVIAVHSATSFDHPIYAGNAIETVENNEPKKVLTIRPTAFAAVAATGSAPIESISAPAADGKSAFVGEELSASERPELTAAKIVVSGGRGLGSGEQYNAVILPLADKLGAAVGASRAAVDAGYVPNDYQVGQTGKVVAPELYLAIGISGAIQHLAGMKDSKVIVAINKDEDAPIFQVADYGLVGDLFEIVPELTKKL